MSQDIIADVKAKLEAIEQLPASEQPDAYRELQKFLEQVLDSNEE